ncbi:MAG: hypothetical protein WB683_18625 [Candidatus Sulfotelmatobacter sp.]
MKGRILVIALIAAALALLSACGSGIDALPGATSGALTVQIVQAPPAVVVAGGTANLAANVLNDKSNRGVTWSCAPANACGTFSPTTAGYQITTVYTAPVAPANGPITPDLAYTVTLTATSVTDSSQSASATVNIAQQYAFVLGAGNGGWGVAGSVTLDGLGNVLGGEADWETNGGGGQLVVIPTSTAGSASFYTLDATGHGTLSLDLSGDVETHGITATSNSHLVIAEEDQFNGYTIGAPGSMDLQTAGPVFSGSQVSGGYSFTLSGYSGAMGENASWGGIFTADGTATATTPGNIAGGIFDENVGNDGGGAGYNSEPPVTGGTGAVGAAGLPFTGTYTAPDANGRGIITLSSSPDTLGPCGAAPLPACTQYAYYLVTPEVLRLAVLTNTGNAGNAGSAFGQGSLATAANDTTIALSGGFIFSYFGFGDNNNGGDSSAGAGQLATDGNGNVVSGIMDFNTEDGGAPTATIVTADIPLTGSTYAISGSPRGTLTTPSGEIFNVYLTDPNLNLLDPNNPNGAGGALLFEANNTSATTTYGNAIGLAIPQATPPPAALTGSYAILLSQQSNLGGCCDYDGGLTGDFTVSTTTPGTFSGEGDFQSETSSPNQATLITGPLTGTFTADSGNPGHFTGTITTTPAFPFGIGGTTPGTENVDFFVANGSQGFVIETDTMAPVFGAIEAQGTITGAAAAKRPRPQQQRSHPKNLLQTTGEQHGRISGQTGSGRE